MTTVLLRPGQADRVVAGHPWIYKGEVLRLTRPCEDGDLVQVKDHRYRFLGTGFYNSRSKIAVRMIARERVVVDTAFFENRLRAALEVRQRHMPTATCFRLVNSEADFLSGLILDKYEDAFVLQTSALAMDRRKPEILGALKALFQPKFILERNESAARRFEGLPEANEVLENLDGGEPRIRRTVVLNGLQYEVDLQYGHKTGLYLDQQSNYQRVGEMIQRIPGAKVLDCFSFNGGFALHAAKEGASKVHGIDQSERAVADARRNAIGNGMESCCSFETANVFDWLKAHTGKVDAPGGPVYDAIILDPPSFTRTRSAVPDALRGYKEIHLRALRLLKPGGTLFTFCCSHHVDRETFQEVILEAALDARKILRRVEIFSQSPDHPVLSSIPETEYLKGFAFESVK